MERGMMRTSVSGKQPPCCIIPSAVLDKGCTCLLIVHMFRLPGRSSSGAGVFRPGRVTQQPGEGPGRGSCATGEASLQSAPLPSRPIKPVVHVATCRQGGAREDLLPERERTRQEEEKEGGRGVCGVRALPKQKQSRREPHQSHRTLRWDILGYLS
ncbi:hypothetical protein Q8A67_019733 [Cirrhinus molitorella]|uniref:Uncharacterized protein n=1 Tax=Cirrhinus molitorella TaxID=172907 RepID=A0AA88PEF9_9TELE|nr:hypothetical protein Q8A67_019733 [Cirrhinus molitorella]